MKIQNDSLCSPLFIQNDFCNNKVLKSSNKILNFQNNNNTYSVSADLNKRYKLNDNDNNKQYRLQLNSLFKQLGDLQQSQIEQSFSNSLREKAYHVGISSYLGSRNYQSDLLFPGGYEYNTLETAKNQLNKDVLSNKFNIDPELSSYDAVVLNNGNNKIHIAYHGASSNPSYLHEDKADIFSVIKGKHETRDSFRRAENVYLNTLKKYPNHDIELLGTSLGGAKSIHVGEKYNVQSTSFNPFLSHVYTPKVNGNAPQNIHRVVTDWATLGALKIPSKSNRKIFHYFENKNPYDLFKSPYAYVTSPHNLKQFFQMPKNNKVNKVNLLKSTLHTIGTGFDVLMFGNALNDARNMSINTVESYEFNNQISEDLNPLGLLGVNFDIDKNYLHDDAPLEARLLADYISNKGPQRMTSFDRSIDKSQSNKYTSINENMIKDENNNLLVNYGT